MPGRRVSTLVPMLQPYTVLGNSEPERDEGDTTAKGLQHRENEGYGLDVGRLRGID